MWSLFSRRNSLLLWHLKVYHCHHYPQPAQSTSHLHNWLLYDMIQYYPPSTSSFPMRSYSLGYYDQNLVHISCFLIISSFLIYSPPTTLSEEYNLLSSSVCNFLQTYNAKQKVIPFKSYIILLSGTFLLLSTCWQIKEKRTNYKRKKTREAGRHHSQRGHNNPKQEGWNSTPIAEAEAGKRKQVRSSSWLANLGDVSWPSEYP